jgi:hypothetical protein
MDRARVKVAGTDGRVGGGVAQGGSQPPGGCRDLPPLQGVDSIVGLVPGALPRAGRPPRRWRGIARFDPADAIDPRDAIDPGDAVNPADANDPGHAINPGDLISGAESAAGI